MAPIHWARNTIVSQTSSDGAGGFRGGCEAQYQNGQLTVPLLLLPPLSLSLLTLFCKFCAKALP